MDGFILGVIISGVVLIITSLLLILFDNKSVRNFNKMVDEKLLKLEGSISDAEKMVNELNNLSDYVGESVESKVMKVLTIARETDELIKDHRLKVVELLEGEKKARNVAKNKINKYSTKDVYLRTKGIVLDETIRKKEEMITDRYKNIILMDSREDQVIELSNNGKSVTEIARQLNIGKGEIELILDLKSKKSS